MNRWMLTATLAVGLVVVARADEPKPVEIDGLKSVPPAAWKSEAPKGMGRVLQFRIAKAEGDPEDAEMFVSHFGKNGGGDKDANIKRWKGQFKDPPADKIKQETFKVGNVQVTSVDISGTYLARIPPNDPNAKLTEKANFRAVNLFFESPNGPYFFKLIGPAKTVDGQKAAFDNWVKAFK